MGVLDIEPGSCDGMLKGVNVGEDEFLSMIDIFDFPMESLEGDDDLTAGWDASGLQSLGPIPTEALMDLPPVPQGTMGNGGAFSDAIRKHNSLGVGNVKPKQLPNYGKQSSKGNIHHEHAPSYPQDSGISQTQSPVSVLETGGSCPAGKSLLMKSDIVIPVRSRSKRARASVFNPWFTMTPVTSATPAYKKAAGYNKPRGRQGVTDESFMEGKEDMYHALYVADYEKFPMKKCSHCQVTKTPQWREGPMGPKTLCNACGVRYRSGRLFPEYRPLASPTFVPTLHSNSHRKVVEMRNKTVVLKHGTIQEGPMTPPMESPNSKSLRKVLEARNKTNVHQKDLMYDVSMSMSPDFVPKRRKENKGLGQENDVMLENVIMHNRMVYKGLGEENDVKPENDIMHENDPNVSMKFMGMRKKAIKQETDSILDPPMSPPPEFIPMSSYLLSVYDM